MLNELPIVIDGPGTYRLRNGKRAQIDSVVPGSTFSAKGSREQEFRGKMVFRGFEIWHPSGRYVALGEHPRDIVGKA